MAQLNLILSCKTLWNSVYAILDRLFTNRCPVSNVLANRTITNNTLAKKLEIKESDWTKMEIIVSIIKPLQILTTILCGEKHSPVSMVRPLIYKVFKNI